MQFATPIGYGGFASSLFFQVAQGFRTIGGDSPKSRASIHLRTVATSFIALTHGAFANTAQALTEDGLSSIYTTAITVDMLGQNWYIVQILPQLGSFLTQSLVVIFCGDVGVALLTVQPTKCNHLIHFKIHFKFFPPFLM